MDDFLARAIAHAEAAERLHESGKSEFINESILAAMNALVSLAYIEDYRLEANR